MRLIHNALCLLYLIQPLYATFSFFDMSFTFIVPLFE